MPMRCSVAQMHSVRSDRGLLVRYPGFRLHRETDQPWGPHELHRFLLECSFPLDALRQKWFTYALDPSDRARLNGDEILKEDMATADIAVICCQSEWYEKEQTALLVVLTGETEGTLHCRWQALVKVYPFHEDPSKRPGDLMSTAPLS